MDFILSPDQDWRQQLRQWAEPFLSALSHAAQRQWAPLYLEGLLLPGERKSVTPLAERVAPEDHEQLHHFVATSPWDPAPLETVLAQKANELAGGKGSSLQVDDTGLLKKGQCSVGVGHQYCGQVGKKANCQTLVSLSLVRGVSPSLSPCACSCPRTGLRMGRGARNAACPRRWSFGPSGASL